MVSLVEDKDVLKQLGKLKFILGQKSFIKGKYTQAIHEFTEAIAYDATVSKYFYERARVYQMTEVKINYLFNKFILFTIGNRFV